MADTTLPPKPDLSGNPRPPTGPRIRTIFRPDDDAASNSQRVLKKIPDAPEGWGEPLEWWQAKRRTIVGAAGWLALFGAIVLTVKTGGLEWLGVWWIWGLMVLVAAVFLIPNDRPLAAGAHWVYHKRTFLRTYELASVHLTRRWPDFALELEQYGKSVKIDASTLQQNPRLWALVYNGITHSVMNGATVIEDDHRHETRKLLALPVPRQ